MRYLRFLPGSLAALVSLASLASASFVVPLSDFVANGTDPDDTIVLNGNLGGTRTLGANTDTKYDGGIHSNLGPIVLANVGDRLTYSFRVQDIVNTKNSANTFRSGFALFDGVSNYAHFHYNTGYGTSTDARFGVNNNNNRYSAGTNFTSVGAFFNDPLLRFDDGNTIDATFVLELVAANASTWDFLFTVTWTNGAATNTMSQLFAGIATNTVTSVYHVMNQASIDEVGASWTISNASAFSNVEVIPEPSVLALLGLAGLALAVRRRRR